MITIGIDQHIVCQLCDGEIRLDADRIAGCLCDPDAPTWIGIEPNGRVLAFSQSNYEIVTNKMDPRNEQFLRGLIGDEAYQIIEDSDGLK